MNKVILIGRLAADPEVRYTQGDKPLCVARYRLAVDRRMKREEDSTADFVPCVAFGKGGEFAEKYLRKGAKIAIVGRVQTGNYTKPDGTKVFTVEIVVEDHEFVEKKEQAPQTPEEQGVSNFFDGIDDSLPF